MSAQSTDADGFPESLVYVPAEYRNPERPVDGVVLAIVAVAGLLVSSAYAIDDVLRGDVRSLWKPGVGAFASLLLFALSMAMLTLRPTCFVRRGNRVALYQSGVRQHVYPIGQVAIFQYSVLRTVRLALASIVLLAIPLFGLPLYLVYADAPNIVGVAWFIASGVTGVAMGVDCLLVRSRRNSTVVVGGIKFTLKRPL